MKDTTYIAFDIDGTIYDSSEIIVDAYHRGIRNYMEKHGNPGISIPGYRELVGVVGIPVEEIFTTLFPGLGREAQREIGGLCNDAFVEIIGKGGGRVFGHVHSTMESLSRTGYVMLAASNGRKEYVEIILRSFDLMKYFSPPFIYTGPGIPDKVAIVARYKEKVSGDNLLIMIGDRYTDRDAALKNKIPFIGCAFGHAGESEIAGSRWIVRGFDEIPGVIAKVAGEV